MKTTLVKSLAWVVLGVAFLPQAYAGKLIYKYADAYGKISFIDSLEDFKRIAVSSTVVVSDEALPEQEIFTAYFADSPEMTDIRNRVKEMENDVTVVVNAQNKVESFSDPGMSILGVSLKDRKIDISVEDYYRPVSTLAHEVSHQYQLGFYGGKLPTTGYGCDGQHTSDEITSPSSAWVEGYAEYHADTAGHAANTDQLPLIYKTGLTKDQGIAGVNCQPNSKLQKWKDSSENDLWASEAVNGLILKEIAANSPESAARIEELIKTGGYADTLKDFLKIWSRTHPEDTPMLTSIVDAYLNFTMSDEEIGQIFGARNPEGLPGVPTEANNSKPDPLATYLARRSEIVKNNKDKYPEDSLPEIKKILERKESQPNVGAGGANGGGGAGGYPTVKGGCFGILPLTDGRPSNFLDLIGKMVEATGSTAQDGLGTAGEALSTIETFVDLADKINLKIPSSIADVGENAGPLGKVLDILSIGGKLDEVGSRCLIALASGSEQDFVDAINDGLKFAVSFVASKLGEWGGNVLGGIGGTALAGPIGTIIGSFVGGWLGGQLGEMAGEWIYDVFLKDWVAHNIGEKLFDLLCPNNNPNGPGPVLPPNAGPIAPPGGTSPPPGPNPTTPPGDTPLPPSTDPMTPPGGTSPPPDTDPKRKPGTPANNSGYGRNPGYGGLSR
jgi:hypothetical protein